MDDVLVYNHPKWQLFVGSLVCPMRFDQLGVKPDIVIYIMYIIFIIYIIYIRTVILTCIFMMTALRSVKLPPEYGSRVLIWFLYCGTIIRKPGYCLYIPIVVT